MIKHDTFSGKMLFQQSYQKVFEDLMKDSIKRNWKGVSHFNNAIAWCAETAEWLWCAETAEWLWCAETAEWLERENKLDKERLFGMLINAMKSDKKPKAAATQPESLQNASAYVAKQPGLEPDKQQLQKLVEAKDKGLIQNLFDSAGDGVLKVIDKLGHSVPWYDWLRVQPN